MAEKGIKIADQTGGESVACRDAVNPDDEANARVIQLVDVAARGGNYDMSAIRTVLSSDILDTGTLPAGITDNLLDVSDASSFVFYGEVTYPSTGTLTTKEKIYVTPMLISDSGLYLENVLAPVQMVPICPTKEATPTLAQCFHAGDRRLHTQLTCMPTYGAKYIGFHIIMEGDASEFRLEARVTSLGGKVQKLEEDIVNGVYGGLEFPLRL